MNTLKSSREKVIPYAVESLRYNKRLGSTMYTVNVYQSQTSRETMQDKVLRLVKNESGGGLGDNSILKIPLSCGTIESLQAVRLSGGSI